MIEIVPAIDMIGGKCVRLSKGDYATKKVYNENPLEVAKMFEDNGITRLHLVDLDGAKAGHIVNHKSLEQIASKTSLVVDFGGGLKTTDDLNVAFECGAKMITGGSIAVKNPTEFLGWLEKYGSDRIILGADAKDGKVAVTGWLEDTDAELLTFVKDYYSKGVRKVICTDIGRDGMLQGPAIELYKQMLGEIADLWLVASGGVSCIGDVESLNTAGISSVIIGKAIYEGRITMKELQAFIG
ncbi:MAG: 1-(5-phosphoribosyl)-5-[(5-phosphoribosylamino)methylideneamino]imidazole-4-carboxamide isomerase [Salinivirgaceae bacterium]|nr:1-(5-phosphoribosyl)-5-[(5-phosphoribosylamino)methylideneamino]imidazole-4-carboxamide isomerase [Salinivirgaceae bacterium]